MDSNTVTAAAGAALAPVKTQSATLLFPGDTQTYTITATNVVGIILNSVTDTIPTGLTFVPGSFKVNGVVKTPTISGQNLSYTVTDAWAIGATLTITFQCTRNS